jgi:D-glycero-D-manno-heptose 1,7-bisphosphate phosphatase
VVTQAALPRAVFLDRDGVLNEPVVRAGRPHPPSCLEELVLYPDVPESLARLKAAGFSLVVVTNQPDVARGTQTKQGVEQLNAAICAQLPLDDVRVCYHDDDDNCGCRKPRPGLLTAAPRYDLNRSFMIGDRWRDVEAGTRAGCRTILIDRGYAERRAVADAHVRSLSAAVDWILANEGQ